MFFFPHDCNTQSGFDYREQVKMIRRNIRNDPFKRTVGSNEETDELMMTHIMTVRKDEFSLVDLHDSLIYNVCTFIDARDLMSVMMANKKIRAIFNAYDVYTKYIKQHGLLFAFARGVFISHNDLMQVSFNHGIDPIYINRAITYAISTNRNDVARALINKKEFTHGPFEHAYCLPMICDEECDACCQEFIKTGCDVDFTIRDLLDVACRCNNLEIVRYIMDTFKVQWKYKNIKTCITNMSMDVLEYLMSRKRVRLGKKQLQTLLGQVILCYDQNKKDVLERMLERKLVYLGRSMMPTIINALSTMNRDVNYIINIINMYASQKLLNNVFEAMLRSRDIRTVHKMLRMCKHLSIRPRSLEFVSKYLYDSCNENNKHVLNIELIMVNKVEMMKRYHIQV
jgi:hypothetical protein